MANTDNKRQGRINISDTAEIKITKKASTNGRSTKATATATKQTSPRTANASQTPRRTASTSQSKSKAPVSNRSKKKKNNDNGAKIFLFIMLLGIAIFVAVVCIKGSDIMPRENDTSTEQGTIAQTQTNTPANQNVPVQGTPDTTQSESSSDEDKPSFYNPVTVTNCDFATVVVNRNYRIPETYADTVDLVYVCGSNQRLQREVAAQYELMYEAGLADGVTLTPCSGYRSYETQTELYNNKINQMLNAGYSEEEAPIQAATVVMVPGSSEHNLGYAMDIVCVDEWFEDTDEFAWLMENAEDYGFILRYPEDKQDVTMVIYEPWHWRYVGVEAAKEINDSGMVLEEYYGKSAQ